MRRPVTRSTSGRIRLAVLVAVLAFAALVSTTPASAEIIGNEPISTVAGTGDFGNTDDAGQTAIGSELTFTYGLAIDAAGNLYIADTGNHRIRKVDTTTGLITTVAGIGSSGDIDDGTATGTQLSSPRQLAFDADGNLYIAETAKHRIRKVDLTTNTISTVAGTGSSGNVDDDPTNPTATGSQIDQPYGLAFDADGNLYIAETGNHRVRKVDLTTNTISTVAGTGTPGNTDDAGQTAIGSQLNQPHGLAFDADGNLYITDANNHRIRKVDSTTGLITTVAGTGTFGNTDDAGQTATGSQLNQPRGLAFDADGNLYITDANNHRIRKVDATTGLITTIAGTGTLGNNEDGTAAGSQIIIPHGLAFDTDGSLYIADTGNFRVRKVDTADTTDPTIAVTSPTNDATITNGTALTADFACADTGTSGLATCTATLNGVAVTNGATINTTADGDQTLVVTATDNAGNTATTTVAFTIAPAVGPRELTGDYANTTGTNGSVARLYMAVFNRQPDGPGYNFWVTQHQAGTWTLRNMAAHFITSDEFVATYGNLTDAEFVDQLYLNVMTRPGDTLGVTYWNTQLTNGMPRSEVVLHFSESPEFKTLTGTS